jgi:hypothetical protein
LTSFAYDRTTDLIVYRHVVNYNYDYNKLVAIVTIDGLPIVEFRILTISRHYCADCYVYLIMINYHHGMMAHCHHLHHHHQIHHGTPMVGYLTPLAHESGHVSSDDCGYLEVCHSDQI